MSSAGKIILTILEVAAIVVLAIYTGGIGGILGAALFAIGSVAITVGFGLLSQALFGKSNAPPIDQSRVNVRIPVAPRYIACGSAMMGGAVVFAEFDGNGALWWIIVHCDSILGETIQYYFDDIPIQLNSDGLVITDAFCLTSNKDVLTGPVADTVSYFRIWTHTYTETDPVPPWASELTASFPGGTWDSSHMLVGTTYSVVKGFPLGPEDRYKVYKWHGPVGIGEPALNIVGIWSNVFDPRDNTQVLGNRATYKPSTNPVLVWAWFRTHRWGRNKPESSINWYAVAVEANICDQSVVGIESTQPRYECGTAIIDTKARSDAEGEILQACDGQLVFDDAGLAWVRVGAYYAPTLAINRNRDVISMASLEAQDGESETQGVVVNYLDPLAGYQSTPSAPWYNPNYYVEGQGNTFLTVDILACQNHNQAMRLAKAIGMRSQPTHKLAPAIGLRGLRAMQERIINLTYDNTFAGDYEICTPIEVDESGLFCTLALAPMDANRFDLLPGEEKPRPVIDTTSSSTAPANVTSVSADFANNGIEVFFAYSTDSNATVQFETTPTASISLNIWQMMNVNMSAGYASFGPVDLTIEQSIRWRAVSSGGATSGWSSPISISPIISPAYALTVTGGVGQAIVAWRNPNNTNFDYNDVWRGTDNIFAHAAVIVSAMPGGVGQPQSITDTGLAAGTYYYWVVASAAPGEAAAPTGPVSGVVT